MGAAEKASTPDVNNRSGRSSRSRPDAPPGSSGRAYALVLKEARRGGLLDGDKTEHVSFRAPPALVEAAKREAGVASVSKLGVMALALMARPDPVAAFFRRTEGRLVLDHELEC